MSFFLVNTNRQLYLLFKTDMLCKAILPHGSKPCKENWLADDLLVEVQQGTIRGHLLTSHANVTYKAFQGIPYAEPPIGQLRFQAPRPPISWQGIRNTTKNANICYEVTTDSPDESEDCLYLNVFTPIYSKVNQTQLPVLFWIHGGGYTHGSGDISPNYMVEKDIIIVTIHYRLGPFGFLATGDSVIPGNAGHKDQAAAIKWTYDNIARFGGDPTKITISGGSAGGSSVGYQLLHKGNEGLIRGAILQSGSSLSPWSFMDSTTAREYAFDLVKQINSSINLKNDTTALQKFLLQVDSKTIDNASTHTTIKRPLPVIEPEQEGAFLTGNQYELLEDGEFIRVPILIGTTSEEEIHQAENLTSLKKYLDKYETHPETLIPYDFKVKNNVSSTLVGNAIKDLYLKDIPDDQKMGHVVKYMSHITFTSPVIKHADLASNFSNVYFYVFSYDGQLGGIDITIKGADKIGHGEESKYLWQSQDVSKYPESDQLTLARVTTLWSNFVKFLTPTPEKSELLQNINWPTFLKDQSKYVDIGNNLEIKIHPKNPYYKAWSQFYGDWAQRPFTTF